jgi:7,8-dihydropterin-6-yl-methyl-4-(beta-D-ribofuranosyl)aminobenzene 5'-phosphate synthase
MGTASESTRVIILVDNKVVPGKGLVPEHGFSALIERNGRKLIFDSGQGPALQNNSVALSVDLTSLDAAVFSHGHYDHTGGLFHIVKLNPGIQVILHPDALSSRLSIRDSATAPRSIGMPFDREMIEYLGANFTLIRRFEEIRPGIWFTGEVPRIFGTSSDPGLFLSVGNRSISDTINDDASLVLETHSGVVLLLGCAHAGLKNIFYYVRRHLGIERLHAVIGGTHLGPTDKSETTAAIEAFEEFHVERIAPAHCTGPGPSEILKGHFGSRYIGAAAGMVLVF